MTNDLARAAIERVNSCPIAFAKFITANETGVTGGHQCGFYISKECVPLIFDKPFERGENHKRTAQIIWNDGEAVTNSVFTYYGKKTRNEYRITSFGRNFEYLRPEHTGDLLIIGKEDDNHYYAYELSNDDEIEYFLDAFCLSPTELNSLIKNVTSKLKPTEDDIFAIITDGFDGGFPDTITMAHSAEEAFRLLNDEPLGLSADQLIVEWTSMEFKLFRHVEKVHYEWVLEEPSESLDAYVKTALEITNRRKARAGRSLEHHLASLFDLYELNYTAQASTEGHKKPDFIFPGEQEYHDMDFPADQLVFLGAKTTCKDRWRQVLNEANRIPKKYLFTLQQSISPYQLEEMHAENLVLVVPEQYHKNYPKTDFESVITLEEFIKRVKETQQAVHP